MAPARIIIVVGAGINGVTAAIELKQRGHEVVLVDPGPLPHPLAASTDISKAVRAAYGADEDYTELAERSINLAEMERRTRIELYHEVGFLFMRQREMQPGDFEYESFELLQRRGHKIERIDSAQLREQISGLESRRLFRDGFLDLEAVTRKAGASWRGWSSARDRSESSCAKASSLSLDESDGRVKESLLDNGERFATAMRDCDGGRRVDAISVAVHEKIFSRHRTSGVSFETRTAGAFRAGTFSGLRGGYFVDWLLRVSAESRRRCERSRTMGRAARCRPISPSAPSRQRKKRACASSCRGAFPALADAPIVYTRVCFYCDTNDGDFWIAPDPERDGI